MSDGPNQITKRFITTLLFKEVYLTRWSFATLPISQSIMRRHLCVAICSFKGNKNMLCCQSTGVYIYQDLTSKNSHLTPKLYITRVTQIQTFKIKKLHIRVHQHHRQQLHWRPFLAKQRQLNILKSSKGINIKRDLDYSHSFERCNII